MINLQECKIILQPHALKILPIIFLPDIFNFDDNAVGFDLVFLLTFYDAVNLILILNLVYPLRFNVLYLFSIICNEVKQVLFRYI